MNETPQANRIHIAFFGLRNAGKSTLVNAFTGQDLAIVSDTPGTTTDPVSKAMEILPLGPCLVTDTAGLDDDGELGAERVRKTLNVLATTDIAVWVWGGEEKIGGESRWTADGRSCCEKVGGECAKEKIGGESRWTEDGRSCCEKAGGECAKEKIGGESRWTKDGSSHDCNSNIQTLKNSNAVADQHYQAFQEECRARHVTVLEFRRGDSVSALRERIASLKLVDDTPGLLDGLVSAGDRVICVCPIDESAPKGRLILPQVQVIRAALDLHATCEVCQPAELASVLETLNLKFQISNFKSQIASGECQLAEDSRGRVLVVTDSQAFGEVREILAASRLSSRVSRLTSFSILFARQKGDLASYLKGLAALRSLMDGDTVLIAEGCTHHRQCNDIGTVKIPKALEKLSGRRLNFIFASGGDFHLLSPPISSETKPSAVHLLSPPISSETKPSAVHLLSPPTFSSFPALVVQCGGCMLTRREVLRRIGVARDAGIPIVNYGMVLAAANGIAVEADACCLA